MVVVVVVVVVVVSPMELILVISDPLGQTHSPARCNQECSPLEEGISERPECGKYILLYQ